MLGLKPMLKNFFFVWMYLLCIASVYGEESKLPLTADFCKAEELAKVYQKPLVLLFLGSDWSPPSQKFIQNILHDREFEKECGNDFIFVKIDFPELNYQSSMIWEKNDELKEKFHVNSFPTVVILDSEGNEISAVGGPVLEEKDFAKHLRGTYQEYRKLQALVAKSLHEADLQELKSLYLRCANLGNVSLMEKILAEGILRKDGIFFFIERYSSLLASDRQHAPEALCLREKILRDDSKEGLQAQLRLAILDFQDLAGKEGVDSKKAIKPLMEYIQRHQEEINNDGWRIYMMGAQYLCGSGNYEEALQLLTEGRDIAPFDHRVDFEEMRAYIKAH